MRRESTYKAQLMVRLGEAFPGFVLLRHEDKTRAGVPDLEILGNGKASYWEAKHVVDGQFEHKKIQTLTMMRMLRAGIHARYIIWEESHGKSSTYIVHPGMIHEWKALCEYFVFGSINHGLVVDAVKRVHP